MACCREWPRDVSAIPVTSLIAAEPDGRLLYHIRA
jgi:hypothetical protein